MADPYQPVASRIRNPWQLRRRQAHRVRNRTGRERGTGEVRPRDVVPGRVGPTTSRTERTAFARTKTNPGRFPVARSGQVRGLRRIANPSEPLRQGVEVL